MLKHTKIEHEQVTYCEKCGALMPFKATIIANNTKRNCPQCGKEYFVEHPAIDWEIIVKNNSK